MRSNSRCCACHCSSRHALALLEVAAGAERLVAGPGHDDAAIGQRVGVDRVEERQQVAAHLRVHRVGDLRPVQGQQHQPVALVLDRRRLVAAFHRSLGHRSLRRIRRVRHRPGATCGAAPRRRQCARASLTAAAAGCRFAGISRHVGVGVLLARLSLANPHNRPSARPISAAACPARSRRGGGIFCAARCAAARRGRGLAAYRRCAGDAGDAVPGRDRDREFAERRPARRANAAVRSAGTASIAPPCCCTPSKSRRPGWHPGPRSARRSARRLAGAVALGRAGRSGNGRDAGLSAGPAAQRRTVVYARGPDRTAAQIGPPRRRTQLQPCRPAH